MDLNETNQLIFIREYIYQTINNPALTRAEINDLSGILVSLDKKIIEKLRSGDFKKFIGFEDVKSNIIKENSSNNIKSSLK